MKNSGSVFRCLLAGAALAAAIGFSEPARAEVSVNINLGPPVVVVEPPHMVLVPRSQVYFYPDPQDRHLFLRRVLVVAAGRPMVPGEGAQRSVGGDRTAPCAAAGDRRPQGLPQALRAGEADPVRAMEETAQAGGEVGAEGTEARGEREKEQRKDDKRDDRGGGDGKHGR